MQLTESEKKVLEETRRIDARWPRTRWITLAFGMAMLVIGVIHAGNFPESSICIGLGLAQLYFLAKLWKGRTAAKLLIKLAQENEDVQ